MLRRVVFPAPFGPITDSSSPRRTSRLTRLTAWTPPKAIETPAISSCVTGSMRRPVSGQPPLATMVMLDVAVALALADSRQPQVELLDVFVVADRLGVAIEHDPAVLHDVSVLGEAERHGDILLCEQDRHVLLPIQAADDLEDLLHQHRREPHGGLVEEHELGGRHERAPDGEHLLLATRGVARPDVPPVRQPRKVAIDEPEVLLRGMAVAARVRAGEEVFL